MINHGRKFILQYYHNQGLGKSPYLWLFDDPNFLFSICLAKENAKGSMFSYTFQDIFYITLFVFISYCGVSYFKIYWSPFISCYIIKTLVFQFDVQFVCVGGEAKIVNNIFHKKARKNMNFVWNCITEKSSHSFCIIQLRPWFQQT